MTTSTPRRLGLLIRWPIGMALAAWRWLWRTTPLRRIDEPVGAVPSSVGRPGEAGVSTEGAQPAADGHGPLFHRTYRAVLRDARTGPEELIEAIAADLNAASPVEVAVFDKVGGQPGPLCKGDEYIVRMPGPWDGPVRVAERTASMFRLITLNGHLEAGQIEFSAARLGDRLVFQIESWARSGDSFADLLYDGVQISKEMQLHMWSHFCERAAKLSGGRLDGAIEIRTGRREDADEFVRPGR